MTFEMKHFWSTKQTTGLAKHIIENLIKKKNF